MKLLRNVSLITIVWSVLYLAGAWLLQFAGLSYRSWIDLLGKITIIWILPLLGVIWLGAWLKKKAVIKRIVRAVLLAVLVSTYLYWAYLGFFGLLFTMDEERRLTSNLIVTAGGGFLDEPHYTYHRPATLFFKVPCEVTLEDKEKYLEEKYDRKFEIRGNEIYSVVFPTVRVSVVLNGMKFEDDFVEGALAECLSCGVEDLDIEREYYVSEGIRKMTGIFYMQLKSESDITGFAEDASRLLAYVCGKTDLFEECRGYFYFYCGEDENAVKGLIPFGKLGKWDEMDSDYYLYPDKLEDYIREKYETSLEYQKKLEADRREYEEQAESHTEALNEPQTESGEPVDVRESSAKIIYEEVLAQQGYSYEVCYNAKGNLYINLGSRPAGEPEDKSDTGTYRFTLVYDRASVNGACELFVLYKEHYAENENGTETNDATAILDMYAVETGTGKVVPSGRQSFSDVGTKEYRELTGE